MLLFSQTKSKDTEYWQPSLLQIHRTLLFALRSLSMLPRFMPCPGGEMAMSSSLQSGRLLVVVFEGAYVLNFRGEDTSSPKFGLAPL